MYARTYATSLINRFWYNLSQTFGMLVGCFGFNCSLRQSFSLYQDVLNQNGINKRDIISERNNIQTAPPHPNLLQAHCLSVIHPDKNDTSPLEVTQYNRPTRSPLPPTPPPQHTHTHIKNFIDQAPLCMNQS